MLDENVRKILENIGLDEAEIEVVDRSDETTEVERCDFKARIGSVKRTDEGYLQGDAAIARVGIMSYFMPGGKIRRELLPERTLFDATSMASLKMKPVTNSHPTQLVNSRTAGRKKVGFTGETVKKDGEYLKTTLVVTDDDAIQAVESGRQELSPGYRAMVVRHSGTHNGEHYDAIQVKRTYNHVALCDQARGGRDLRINVDTVGLCDGFALNEDAVTSIAKRNRLPDSSFCFVKGNGDDKVRKFLAFDAAHVRDSLARLPQADITPAEKATVLDSLKSKAKRFGIVVKADTVDELESILKDNDSLSPTKRSRFMARITLDGIDYDADQQVINYARRVESERDDHKVKLDAKTTELETITAERDTLKTKNDELEAEKKDGKGTKDAVKARLELERVAKEHLDEKETEKLDEMSDADVRKAVILSRFPDAKEKLDAEDTAEEYVLARFDATVELLEAEAKENKDGKGGKGTKKGDKSKGSNMADQRASAVHRTDSSKKDEPDQEKSRADMGERMRNAWNPNAEKKEDK